MGMVPVRELRNHTNDVIQRVRDGEDMTITANGVPVATLIPLRPGKRASISRDEFVRVVRLADPALRDDLAALAGDTTDDLGPMR